MPPGRRLRGHLESLWRLNMFLSGFIRGYSESDLSLMQAAWRRCNEVANGMMLATEISIKEHVRQEQLELWKEGKSD